MTIVLPGRTLVSAKAFVTCRGWWKVFVLQDGMQDYTCVGGLAQDQQTGMREAKRMLLALLARRELQRIREERRHAS